MRRTAGDGGRRRLRAITFDIRNYRSAVGVAARRGRLRGHSAGVRGAGAGQRGRVASARGPPLSELDRRSAAPRRRCAPAFYTRLNRITHASLGCLCDYLQTPNIYIS